MDYSSVQDLVSIPRAPFPDPPVTFLILGSAGVFVDGVMPTNTPNSMSSQYRPGVCGMGRA